MSDSIRVRLETVDDKATALERQKVYIEALERLGMIPGALVGYRPVRTATGRVYELYVRAPEWMRDVLEARQKRKPFGGGHSSGVLLK